MTASNVCLVILYVCLYLVQTVRSDAAGVDAKRIASLPNMTASSVCLVILYVCLYLVQTVRSDAAGVDA